MPRPIWKGQISFGLVNVPVTLYSAEQKTSFGFTLIDKRNAARVRYKRVNEATGEDVPWDDIVKGYEYEEGNYVLLTNDELQNASAELTKVVEIEQFVDREAIPPVYFERPYYLEPRKGGEKGYVLLREAMRSANKAGLAQVVIRDKGHLAAMFPQDNALVLNLLRFQQELRPLDGLDLPGENVEDYKINKKELALAGQLVDGMVGEWRPEQFENEYRAAVMEMIEERISTGETRQVHREEEAEPEPTATVNFMDVLKQSVEASKGTTPGKPGPKRGKRAS